MPTHDTPPPPRSPIDPASLAHRLGASLARGLAASLALGLAACGDDGGGSGGGSGGGAGTGATTPTSGSGSGTSGGAGGGGGTTTGPGASGTTGTSGGGAGGASASFAEMCARPGVVFCDGFEGGWHESWMEDGGDVAVVPGAAVAGEGSSVLELSTYEDIQSSKLLRTFDPADTIHVRFDVQYDAAYDNSAGSHGPVLGGSDAPPWGMFGTAGIQPDGTDFFVLNFEPTDTVGQGGELGFYAYFASMSPDGHGDFWGNVFTSSVSPPPVIVPGAWHCAEYALSLNTVGAEDGTASFWVDGIHHGTFDGFVWRTDEALRISTFSLDSYNHMREGPIPAAQANRVRYDNLVIATAPVGCLE